jgi:hypothetical protein
MTPDDETDRLSRNGGAKYQSTQRKLPEERRSQFVY